MTQLFRTLLLLVFVVTYVPTMAAAQTSPGEVDMNGDGIPDGEYSGGDGPNDGYYDEEDYGEDENQNYGSEEDDRRLVPFAFGQQPRERTRMAQAGRSEVVVSGPQGEFPSSNNTLTALGAVLLRYRDLPNLGLRIAVYDFQSGLSIRQAQEALNAVTPNTVVGLHHVYQLSQSAPRLYAPGLIGDAAPGVCRIGGNFRVGIIDGPVDPDHPALAGANISTQSVLNADERAPTGTHGTAVAALVVGENSDAGLSGFAPGADLLAVSAFTQSGGNPGADIERIAAAIDYLLARDVRLINMSFAGPENPVLEIVLDEAASAGAVMIAAAGNNGMAYAAYPAAHQDVIAVTAVDAAMRRYRDANFGRHIEFAAPGVDIYVASNRGGGYASGTSYAAPIVTALAARLGAGRTLSVAGLRARLQATAVDLGDDGFDSTFGWGLVRGGC